MGAVHPLRKNPLAANCDDIRATLEFVHPPDSEHYLEVRIPKTNKGTWSGVYRAVDTDRIVDQVMYAVSWTGDAAAPAIYLTLNPCKPDCWARPTQNRLKSYVRETTGDNEISCRTVVLTDADPVRISGISSTDAEHEAALARIGEVRDYLLNCGIPDGLLGDSGNGGHFLFLLDSLPNDAATTDLIRTLLEALADKFSDNVVKLDRGVFNAARISKVYGTPVRKGTATDDRPHRLARILHLADAPRRADADLLRKVIGSLGGATKARASSSAKASSSSSAYKEFPQWFRAAGLDQKLKEPKPWKDGTIWAFNGFCPWSSDHADGAAFVALMPGGAWGAGCHHDTCKDQNWHTLRAKYDDSGPAAPDDDDPDAEPQTPTKYNDLNCARLFAERHTDDLRYVDKLGRWLRYVEAEGRWGEDEKLEVYTLCKKFLTLLSIEAFNDAYHAAMAGAEKDDKDEEDARSREAKALAAARRVADAIASAKKVNAVVTLGRSDPKLVATVDQFDRDPFLLNTPGGVVNLKTGEIRPAQRTDYLTKCSEVAPVEMPTPIFDQFVRDIMGAQVPLASCNCAACVDLPAAKRTPKAHAAEVERLVSFNFEFYSYCLTADVAEHVLMIQIGDGGNGKGVENDLLGQDILGLAPTGYSCEIPIEALLDTKGSRHPTDQMALLHARLAIARESENRQWNEGLMKRLSGGDVVTARKMRMDFVTFEATHKLVIFGQHKPVLRGAFDAAWRRRLHLLPYPQKFDDPPDKKNGVLRADRGLRDKLRAEASGILYKLIQVGVKRNKRGGFAVPATVRNASRGYLEAQDLLGEWIADSKLVAKTGGFLTTENLYGNWKTWCESRNIPPGRISQFPDEVCKRIPGARRFRHPDTGSGIAGVEFRPLTEQKQASESKGTAQTAQPKGRNRKTRDPHEPQGNPGRKF